MSTAKLQWAGPRGGGGNDPKKTGARSARSLVAAKPYYFFDMVVIHYKSYQDGAKLFSRRNLYSPNMGVLRG
jgi:hypothetical protein